MCYTCDPSAILVANPITKESFGQIQGIIFQKKYSAAGVLNTISAATAVTTATWTALQVAVDDTIIVPFKEIYNVIFAPGAARSSGSGQAVRGGIPYIIGPDFTAVTAEVHQVRQDVIERLKVLFCGEVGVYYIDECGKMKARVDDIETPTTYYPIPIVSAFAGDLKPGDYEAHDMNALNWSHLPHWSNDTVNLELSDGNFLTDIIGL